MDIEQLSYNFRREKLSQKKILNIELRQSLNWQ